MVVRVGDKVEFGGTRWHWGVVRGVRFSVRRGRRVKVARVECGILPSYCRASTYMRTVAVGRLQPMTGISVTWVG